MTPEELIKAGDLEGALAAAKDAVRSNPADAKARIFLFQVECVLGDWEKARNQLGVLADIDINTKLFAQIFGPAIDCELLRREIFAGAKTPIIFGDPEPWMGHLVHANQLAGQGEYAAANDLRATAFEAAEATPGDVNGEPMAWIADADTRLGPMLEVIMDGCYRWVPFCRIATITIDPPHDLRDLIWTPVRFEWANGGAATGFIPARYPGTDNASDPSLKLSRRTDWEEKAPDLVFGLGQRVLATDAAEYPLLEVRKVTLQTSNAG